MLAATPGNKVNVSIAEFAENKRPSETAVKLNIQERKIHTARCCGKGLAK